MKSLRELPFEEIWCVDFEFRSNSGERPEVRCMVAREYFSGRLVRCWSEELGSMEAAPFRTDSGALLMNFPMQANGAEMLRLACCLATEDGLEIVAPVHDALAMVAPLDCIDEHTECLLAHMRSASEIVLGGFVIRAEVEAEVIYPKRYIDKAGEEMWEKVTSLII